MQTPDISIITESYNMIEGATLESLRRSLRCASQMIAARGAGEILLADVHGIDDIDSLLEEFPLAHGIDCQGLGYDAAKNRAIEHARGTYVVFLDGDCEPQPGWLEGLLEPLTNNQAFVSCGVTAYAGGFWAALQTVMDFGFLLPGESRAVGCYACNNWAARRSLLLANPIPVEAHLRCTCYPHAQELIKQGTPAMLAPTAKVLHDLPDFWPERLRRGWDYVAVCWQHPDLAKSNAVHQGLRALPGIYLENVALDWQCLRENRAELGMSHLQARIAQVLVCAIHVIDMFGTARALRHGPS